VPPMQARQGFLFVGAVHPDTPNEDGLLWFASEVLPILRGRLTDAITLDIVGDCRSEKIAALAGDQMRVIGRVDDLTPFYDRSRVFVAPARFAAGVPAKVIEAACNGIPVVASHLLVRQLAWRPETEIISARDALSFAEGMARLYCDQALWMTIQNGARRRTRAEVGPERFKLLLREVLS
jgi:glycosyltransferase involved in cell wall biosynthesis